MEQNIIKRNLNVEIDEDLYFKLREKAAKDNMEFHAFIRNIYQKEMK